MLRYESTKRIDHSILCSRGKTEINMILTRDKSFYKTLVALALPIALQNLITFAIGLSDNIMIGALGDNAVSGVYMGNQIQTLLQVFSAGIEGAILVLSAQYWGKKDTDSIRKIVAIGLKISLFFGFMLTIVCIFAPKFVISLFTNDFEIIQTGAQYLKTVAFSYVFFCFTQGMIAAMRSVENPRIGLYVSFSSFIINLGLNYLLIFGKLGFPALGINGAAIATLISRIAEALIVSIYVFIRDKKLKLKFSDIKGWNKRLLLDFIKYGTPIILGQLVWATNMLANSAIMGRQNLPGVVAGLSIANTLNNLAYVVMNGMAGAVGIITGKTIGEGKEELMREYARTVQILFLSLGILTGLGLQLIKSPFVGLYNVTPEAIGEATKYINVLSVTFIGTCYQAAGLAGLVKSGGDTSFVFKLDLIFVFLIVLPLAIIATRLGLAPWIVFAALKCDQIIKCAVAVIKINSFNWMKNLTRVADKT